MARFVKIILFSLLMITLHGVTSNVSASQVELVKHDITSSSTQQQKVRVPEFPYLPVADLNCNLQTHHASTTRVQRVQAGEYLFFFKNILLNYANKEASSLLNWSRISGTTTSYHYKQTGEYYVFALRHIII